MYLERTPRRKENSMFYSQLEMVWYLFHPTYPPIKRKSVTCYVFIYLNCDSLVENRDAYSLLYNCIR